MQHMYPFEKTQKGWGQNKIVSNKNKHLRGGGVGERSKFRVGTVYKKCVQFTKK